MPSRSDATVTLSIPKRGWYGGNAGPIFTVPHDLTVPSLTVGIPIVCVVGLVNSDSEALKSIRED